MKVKEIILHCSATPEGRDVKASDIDRMHKERGFKKIGYHYVIDLDGKVEKGREETQNGAHCLNHNATSLGICYIGGVDKKMKPKDTRTLQQKISLFELVNTLMTKYNLTLDDVHGHYEFANKACPSFDIKQWKEDFNNYFNLK